MFTGIRNFKREIKRRGKKLSDKTRSRRKHAFILRKCRGFRSVIIRFVHTRTDVDYVRLVCTPLNRFPRTDNTLKTVAPLLAPDNTKRQSTRHGFAAAVLSDRDDTSSPIPSKRQFRTEDSTTDDPVDNARNCVWEPSRRLDGGTGRNSRVKNRRNRPNRLSTDRGICW